MKKILVAVTLALASVVAIGTGEAGAQSTVPCQIVNQSNGVVDSDGWYPVVFNGTPMSFHCTRTGNYFVVNVHANGSNGVCGDGIADHLCALGAISYWSDVTTSYWNGGYGDIAGYGHFISFHVWQVSSDRFTTPNVCSAWNNYQTIGSKYWWDNYVSFTGLRYFTNINFPFGHSGNNHPPCSGNTSTGGQVTHNYKGTNNSWITTIGQLYTNGYHQWDASVPGNNQDYGTQIYLMAY